MKRITLLCLLSINMFYAVAQTVNQQEYFELNEVLPAYQEHHYTASDYIKLLPGFHSKPSTGSSAMLEVNSQLNTPTPYGNDIGASSDFPPSFPPGRIGDYNMAFDVNDAGAATISIPLEFPEGINGMTPKLSLNYNSQGGNGIMGHGWALGGMSKISRVPYTYYYNDDCHAVAFSNDDQLSLDGNILIEGTKDGAVCYYPEIYDYSIIYPYNNGEGFKVLKKDGSVWFYTARYHLQNSITVPIEWHLSKITDKNGNSINYFYQNDREDGSFYPTSITYTTSAGVEPAYTIQFVYAAGTRGDTQKKWFSQNNNPNNSGFSLITKQLWAIQCYYNSEKILQYTLDYTTLDWNILALNAVSKSSFVYDSEKKHPDNKMVSTVFEWVHPDYQLDYETAGESLNLNAVYNDDYQWYQYTAFAARFESDKLGGLQKYENDIVHVMTKDFGSARYMMNVLLSNNVIGGTGQSYSFIAPGSLGHFDCSQVNERFKDGRIIHAFLPVDTDGDGLNEIVCVYSLINILKVSIIRPDAQGVFQEEVIHANLPNADSYSDFHVGDFNGDGLTDLMCIKNPNNPALLIWMSSYGNPFGQLVSKEQVCYFKKRIVIGDFHGDKREQIMILSESNSVWSANLYRIEKGQNGQFYIPAPVSSEQMTDIAEKYYQPSFCNRLCQGDFNGDGKTDILLLCNGEWQLYVSKGNARFTAALQYLNQEITGDSFVISTETAPALHSKMRPVAIVADFDHDGCDDLSISKMDTIRRPGAVPHQIDIYNAVFRRDFLIRLSDREMDVRRIKKVRHYWLNGQLKEKEVHIDSIKEYEGVYYAAYNQFVPVLGNHKGTSPSEIIYCRLETVWQPTFYLRLFLHNTGNLIHPAIRAINKIYDSFGAITEIDYRPVSYQKPADRLYDASSANRDITAVLPFNGRLDVVDEVRQETRDGGEGSGSLYRTTKYHFSRPWIHTRGRGLLGFGITWCRRQGQIEKNDIQTTKKFVLSQDYNMLVPLKFYRETFDNAFIAQQFEVTDFLYSFKTDFPVSIGQVPDGVFYPYLSESKTSRSDGSPFRFQKTSRQLDDYGNVHTWTNRYGGSWSNLPYFERKTLDYDNSIGSGRWIIGMLKKEVLQQTLNGESASQVSRTTTYVNNMAAGLCTSKTTEPQDNSLKLTETYSYDGFGNLTSVLSEGSGIERTQSKTYSSDGRFVMSSTNAENQTTSYTYNEKNGFLKTVTDPNGLTTTYHYDVLGDLIKTEYPNGVLEEKSKKWVVTNPAYPKYHPDTPEFGSPVYFEWSKRSGEGERYVFCDQHNRKIREVALSLCGKKIYTDYHYHDVTGLLTSVSNPYLPGNDETPCFTEYTYDYLDRMIRVNRADGAVMTHNYNGTTESIQDFDQRKTVLHFNNAGLVTKSENMGSQGNAPITEVNYTYYGDGKVKSTKTSNDAATTVTYIYDANRNPLSITDPSLGELTYNYNAFGELTASTTPRDETSYTYDALGRMTQRSGGDGHSYWTYDNGFVGALSRTKYVPAGGPIVTEDFQYDSLGRLIRQTQKVGNGEERAFDYAYNRLGKQSSLTYPSGKKVKYHYNRKGFMDRVKDAATGEVLWQAVASDRWGNISSFTEGNIDVNCSYDPVTGLVNNIRAKRNGTMLLDQSYHWTTTGNLQWRTDATLDLKESFGYDGFNRLTSAVAKNLAESQTYSSQSFDYDPKGNITQKTGVGSYSYGTGASTYAVTGLQPEAGQEALFAHQEATYTSFDKLRSLEQDGKTLSLNYGIDRQRVMQTFSDGNTTRTKRYFTPLYETVTENGVTKKMHYLTSSTGLFAIFVSYNNGGGAMHYTLKDHQGNLTATIHGNAVERLGYDAWGRCRNPVGFGYDNVSHTFDRGYTLHEHYDDFGLINMNGRLYDPVLGRMLSPDIAVQDGHNAQAYNRYSYCLNNPLRFTDPSGWVVRGSRDYFDWSSISYLGFDSFRNNSNAFNTDLSEGKFSPIYDVNGVLLGTTKEGFTGQVLIYEGSEDFDFSSLSESEALMIEGVSTFDKMTDLLTSEAMSNIWTSIVSQMEGVRVYDEVFHVSDLHENKIVFDPNVNASWLSTYTPGTGTGRIQGSNKYHYETTVENIQSSIVVHEYYSHIKKNNGDNYKSHRLAYKNVINYKPLWNKTTNAYKGFVVRRLLDYTNRETGRTKVDSPYRYSYNKYKNYH